MKKTLNKVQEENSKNNPLLESIERNAHKFYKTAPVHDGKSQPLEKIEKRLREAYDKNSGAKGISEALFVNSFPKAMVKSITINDTNKRLNQANDMQKNSESLVQDFLSSPASSKEEKLDAVLRKVLELRETIPVTRRIDLNRGNNNNSWTESVSTSSTTSKNSGLGRGNF